MENAGAVTIRDQYVFRSKVTDASYEARAETILHELAHMWFGDLVTMEWWNDLWLNESFATYTEICARSSAEGTRWPHGWTTFANPMKTWAYRQDQLPSTHPIMAEINDLEDVQVNFDGITYAKGASVLKQLVAYVGQDAFFKGVQAYFKQHAWGNSTAPRPAGRAGADLRPRPQGLVEGVAGDRRHQHPAPGDRGGRRRRAHLLRRPPGGPGAARRRQGRGRAAPAPDRHRHVRPDATASWSAPSGSSWTSTASAPRFPSWRAVSGRRWCCSTTTTCRTPRSGWTRDSLAAVVTEHIGAFTDSLPRALCWAAAWDMTRDGELAARDYLELVLSGIGRESDIGVVQSLQRQVKLGRRAVRRPGLAGRGPGRGSPTPRWSSCARPPTRQRPPARLGPRVGRRGAVRRAAGLLAALLDGRVGSTAWPWTPSCAGRC